MELIKKLAFFFIFAISSIAHADPININTADADSIAESLYGVGVSKAQRVIEYRESNGPFEKIEDLAFVKGIGLKTIEKNKENLILE